jgi:hypothetical protein
MSVEMMMDAENASREYAKNAGRDVSPQERVEKRILVVTFGRGGTRQTFNRGTRQQSCFLKPPYGIQ